MLDLPAHLDRLLSRRGRSASGGGRRDICGMDSRWGSPGRRPPPLELAGAEALPRSPSFLLWTRAVLRSRLRQGRGARLPAPPFATPPLEPAGFSSSDGFTRPPRFDPDRVPKVFPAQIPARSLAAPAQPRLGPEIVPATSRAPGRTEPVSHVRSRKPIIPVPTLLVSLARGAALSRQLSARELGVRLLVDERARANRPASGGANDSPACLSDLPPPKNSISVVPLVVEGPRPPAGLRPPRRPARLTAPRATVGPRVPPRILEQQAMPPSTRMVPEVRSRAPLLGVDLLGAPPFNRRGSTRGHRRATPPLLSAAPADEAPGNWTEHHRRRRGHTPGRRHHPGRPRLHGGRRVPPPPDADRGRRPACQRRTLLLEGAHARASRAPTGPRPPSSTRAEWAAPSRRNPTLPTSDFEIPTSTGGASSGCR